ncbi:LOW QUALITY PROTEIN: sphingosine kinase 2-like [Manacus candei]|uniref:LOW QUALITY PROTEIN: sphingosine kinase 2-like n=1 Tax=Manacus candei TaxID=415023 RepID=UPI0022263941|nr:LOW QUALITY PROTEIN: sphingosine kinase 2-like [Manacus candei]
MLLNPFGGRGRALRLCQSHVLPMVCEAGISFNLVQTERPNHAKELVSGLSLEQWDGIVTVSGDGLVFEVLNGLLSRPDWALALRVPLGVLPCGSGNGLAAALNCHAGLPPALGVSLLQNCSLLLCRGWAAPLDVLSVSLGSGARLWSVLAVAWGLVAEADVGSERLRRLGPARFLLAAAARLLVLSTHRARLAWLPPQEGTDNGVGMDTGRDRDTPTRLAWLPAQEGTDSGVGMDTRMDRDTPTQLAWLPAMEGMDNGVGMDTGRDRDTRMDRDTWTRLDNGMDLESRMDRDTRMDGDNRMDTGRDRDTRTRLDNRTELPALEHVDNGMERDNEGQQDTRTGLGRRMDPPALEHVDNGLNRNNGTNRDSWTQLDGGTQLDTRTQLDTGTQLDTRTQLDRGTQLDRTQLDRGTQPDTRTQPDPGPPPGPQACPAPQCHQCHLFHGLWGPPPGTPPGDPDLSRAVSDPGLCDGDGGGWGDTPGQGGTPNNNGATPNNNRDTPGQGGTPNNNGDTPNNNGATPNNGPPRITGPPQITSGRPRPGPPQCPQRGPPDDLLVPLGQALPPGWVSLEGDFVLVVALSPSHLGADLVAAPRARPDDGLLHLLFVRGGVSRGSLLRALLAMARGGDPGGGPGTPLSRVPARAFRLEPLGGGTMTVDGERVPCGPVQGQLHPGLARAIMALPPK